MKPFKAAALTALVSIAATTGAVAQDIGARAFSDIVDAAGDVIGRADFVQGFDGVVIEIKLAGLPAGKHGMHVHAVGACEHPSGFMEAMGHLSSEGRPHGFLNPDGPPHEGDLPNLIMGDDGSVHVELYTDSISISGRGGKLALLDEDGSALMIHANEDDHVTQPTGGSGPRVACGVVRAADAAP